MENYLSWEEAMEMLSESSNDIHDEEDLRKDPLMQLIAKSFLAWEKQKRAYMLNPKGYRQFNEMFESAKRFSKMSGMEIHDVLVNPSGGCSAEIILQGEPKSFHREGILELSSLLSKADRFELYAWGADVRLAIIVYDYWVSQTLE